MSWALLNTILALEVFVVYLVSVNVNNMLRATSEIRQWVMPLDDEHTDIREEMTKLCNGYSEKVLAMLRNFRFIVVPATLAVFANMYGSPVAWIPFWASIGFTLESVLNLYQINIMGNVLGYNINSAQAELADRAYFAEVEKLADEMPDHDHPDEEA